MTPSPAKCPFCPLTSADASALVLTAENENRLPISVQNGQKYVYEVLFLREALHEGADGQHVSGQNGHPVSTPPKRQHSVSTSSAR